MKLNLLPTYVSKEGQSKVAWVVFGVFSLASIAAGAFAVIYSQQQLDKAKDRVATVQPAYQACVDTAKRADDIMASSIVIDRNLRLAQAMEAHSTVYPDLYRDVLSYVPSFFRVNQIAAASTGPGTCAVTMQGVLESYQQYADIMLAMLRIPGATNVTRSGFTDVRPVVPALNEQDQVGTAVRPGQGNLPSDPQSRLDELVARAGQAPTGYLGVSGFGTPGSEKGAMPDWSTVTITVVLNRDIQTPNPRATLASQGGAQGGPPAPNGGGSSGFTPPAPGTISGGVGGGGGSAVEAK